MKTDRTASEEPIRVLVVDDDAELCDLLVKYLGAEGIEVDAVSTGSQGIEQILRGRHNLAILDVMLPGANGFDVLRRIRGASPMPVLMLTARGEEVDRIVGLELGADDYLPKPFNPRELVARIHAILRRARPAPPAADAAAPGALLVVGDVQLDPHTRTVRRDGAVVDLTAVEFNLLEELLRGAGRVLTRNDLGRRVLGRRLESYDRSLDMHISNLRKKLGHAAGGVERIKTLRGVGYAYAAPPGPPQAGAT